MLLVNVFLNSNEKILSIAVFCDGLSSTWHIDCNKLIDIKESLSSKFWKQNSFSLAIKRRKFKYGSEYNERTLLVNEF